jgi:16S rRNA U516 pseudouridylate synthase RsuA-like enzyme
MNFIKWKRCKIEEKVEDGKIRLIDKIYNEKFRNSIFRDKDKNNDIIMKKENIVNKISQIYLLYNKHNEYYFVTDRGKEGQMLEI